MLISNEIYRPSVSSVRIVHKACPFFSLLNERKYTVYMHVLRESTSIDSEKLRGDKPIKYVQLYVHVCSVVWS